jgi:hypothetical protein
MYHSGSSPYLAYLSDWKNLQDGGAVADGVAVFNGSKYLIIAPTQGSAKFASASIDCGGTMTSDRGKAQEDWNGQTNTASQLTHSECSSDGYAAYYCNTYSRGGLTAGKWWFPSLGEMMLIVSNLKKINYALSLISGSTQLTSSDWYWTSTEYDKTQAWRIMVSSGSFFYFGKDNRALYVRPVSAFVV